MSKRKTDKDIEETDTYRALLSTDLLFSHEPINIYRASGNNINIKNISRNHIVEPSTCKLHYIVKVQVTVSNQGNEVLFEKAILMVG